MAGLQPLCNAGRGPSVGRSHGLARAPIYRLFFLLLLFHLRYIPRFSAVALAHFGVVIHTIVLQPFVEFLGRIHVDYTQLDVTCLSGCLT